MLLLQTPEVDVQTNNALFTWHFSARGINKNNTTLYMYPSHHVTCLFLQLFLNLLIFLFYIWKSTIGTLSKLCTHSKSCTNDIFCKIAKMKINCIWKIGNEVHFRNDMNVKLVNICNPKQYLPHYIVKPSFVRKTC